jgi:hypothetical protein
MSLTKPSEVFRQKVAPAYKDYLDDPANEFRANNLATALNDHANWTYEYDNRQKGEINVTANHVCHLKCACRCSQAIVALVVQTLVTAFSATEQKTHGNSLIQRHRFELRHINSNCGKPRSSRLAQG